MEHLLGIYKRCKEAIYKYYNLLISLNFFKGGNLHCLVEEIYTPSLHEVKYELGILSSTGESGKKCPTLIWLLKLNIFPKSELIFPLLLLIHQNNGKNIHKKEICNWVIIKTT